jgi:hypothetical protein
MDIKNLENCVSGEHLRERGFRKHGNVMYRMIHQQEIRFIEVVQNMYIFDGVYYSKKRPVERYEESLSVEPTNKAEQSSSNPRFKHEASEEWKDEMDKRFEGLQNG